MRHIDTYHTTLGYDCHTVGRGKCDMIARVQFTWRGIHTTTRKGHHFITSWAGSTTRVR